MQGSPSTNGIWLIGIRTINWAASICSVLPATAAVRPCCVHLLLLTLKSTAFPISGTHPLCLSSLQAPAQAAPAATQAPPAAPSAPQPHSQPGPATPSPATAPEPASKSPKAGESNQDQGKTAVAETSDSAEAIKQASSDALTGLRAPSSLAIGAAVPSTKETALAQANGAKSEPGEDPPSLQGEDPPSL